MQLVLPSALPSEGIVQNLEWPNIAVAVATFCLAFVALFVPWNERRLAASEKQKESARQRVSFLLALQAYFQACEFTLQKYVSHAALIKAQEPRRPTLQNLVPLELIPLHVHNRQTIRDIVQTLCDYGALDESWEFVRHVVESALAPHEPSLYDVIPGNQMSGKDSWQVIVHRGHGNYDTIMRHFNSGSSKISSVDHVAREALTRTQAIIASLGSEIRSCSVPPKRGSAEIFKPSASG